MKPNLQTIKEDIAELKNSHEALEIVVKTLVKNVANFEVRLKESEECSRNQPKYEVIINQMVKGHKDAIDVIEVKLKILEKENDTKMLKVCRYHNRGYCKQKRECKFYHAQNVCESVSRNELCVLKSCSERHPKTCKHWKRGECRRGQSCAYSHQEIYKQKNPDIEIYNESPKPKPNNRFLNMLIVKFVTHVARHLKMKLLYAASVKEYAAKAAKIKCNYGKEKIMNFVNMCVFQ